MLLFLKLVLLFIDRLYLSLKKMYICVQTLCFLFPSPMVCLIFVPVNKSSAQNSGPLAETLNQKLPS